MRVMQNSKPLRFAQKSQVPSRDTLLGLHSSASRPIPCSGQLFRNQKYGIWASLAEKNHHQTELRRDATNFSDALRVAPVCSSNACTSRTSHQIQQRLDLTGLWRFQRVPMGHNIPIWLGTRWYKYNSVYDSCYILLLPIGISSIARSPWKYLLERQANLLGSVWYNLLGVY